MDQAAVLAAYDAQMRADPPADAWVERAWLKRLGFQPLATVCAWRLTASVVLTAAGR